MASLDRAKPFFLYLHLIDPHDPYDPPPAFRGKFGKEPLVSEFDSAMRSLVDLYDGEIQYMDAQLGDFFAFLKSKGLWQNSLVIVIGDHGEQFMEHGYRGHGYNLYNDELNIPLIIHTGTSSGVEDALVASIDILPTILDYLQIDVPKEVQGVSTLNTEQLKLRFGVMAEIDRRYGHTAFAHRSFSSNNGFRLIVSKGPGQTGNNEEMILFNWHGDGAGRRPITDLGLLELLKTKLDLTLEHAQQGRVEIEVARAPDRTIEQLKSLGYLK